MSAISDATEASILNLLFLAATWEGYATNALAEPEANITVSLHTASPGDAGTSSTFETGYVNYLRQSVPRSATGWTPAVHGVVHLVSEVRFPPNAALASDVTHFALGKSGAGGRPLLFYGSITPAIPLSAATGIPPRLTAATSIAIR